MKVSNERLAEATLQMLTRQTWAATKDEVSAILTELQSLRNAQSEAVAWTTPSMLDAKREPEIICGFIWSRQTKDATVPLYPAPQSEAVAVKALEWEARGKFIEFSPTAFGEYTVEYYEESDGCGWECVYDGAGTIGYFPTEAEAKSAAQADYEQRIRSALTHPAPPLVVTDEMGRKLVTKWREVFPGGGWPDLGTAKELLTAALEAKQ